MAKLIEILHQVSDQMLEVVEEREVYKIMSRAIKKILPGAFFLVSKLQPNDMNFRIVESSGFDSYFDIIKNLVGKDPYTLDFPFENFTENQIKAFTKRKMFHFPGGIHEVANGAINKPICKAIEKLLGISDVCAMSFCVEEKYFGGITLFIPKSVVKAGTFTDEAEMAIETISNQASSVIQKLRDHNALKKNEVELLISRTRFNQLVNNLNDVIWKANLDDMIIQDLNNSFERYYGYPSSEFTKNPDFWIEIVHPEDKEIALKSKSDLINSGNSSTEYRVIKPDGKVIWLHDRKSIVYDNNGKPTQMGGVVSDITERKLLEEQLKIKDYALNASPIAVGLSDLNGILFYANDAYAKLWAYNSKEEVIGKHVSEFASSNDQLGVVMKTIKEGKVYRGEGESIRIDGTKFNSLISARSVTHEDRPVCLMAVFVDITERKRSIQQLKEQSSQLKNLNNTKDKFFSIIAHDLKSPFNSILGFTELLANNYDDFSNEKRLEIIKMLYLTSQRTFELLVNLLDWSTIQRGRLVINKEIINLKSLIDSGISPYKQYSEEKKISVDNNIDHEIQILADKNSIKTVVRNLFINAVKFTHNGGHVKFDAMKLDKNIELMVSDTGVGMNNDRISSIFRIDENVSTPGTNNEKGTGLGLILCKELIGKNGGEISVESKIGKGTVFKVLMPSPHKTNRAHKYSPIC
ncbi:MAG: PAS domain S-box protein [Bacteroidetes bacterium]|nr:PAS domain S-box protein [Bacteroidota bacterium]